jgi:hypothetical protein
VTPENQKYIETEQCPFMLIYNNTVTQTILNSEKKLTWNPRPEQKPLGIKKKGLLILFLDCYILWLWAVLLMFQRYMMPPSSFKVSLLLQESS